MSVPSYSSPVNEMFLAVGRDDQPLWPMPIIRDVDARSEDAAMSLVIAFIRSQLHRVGSANTKALREGLLAKLDALRSSLPAREEVSAICQDIWYTYEERDWSKIAIYRAFEELTAVDRTRYCMILALAVMAAAPVRDEIRSNPDSVAPFVELYNAAVAGK